jgi:hypothetical protein
LKNLGRSRLEAATGALFCCLLVVGVIVAVTPPPPVGASTADIVSYYSLRGPALHVVDLCFVLAAASLLWFIAPITVMICRLRAPSSRLVIVTQSAAVAFAAVYMGGVAVFQAAVLEATRPQSADLTHVLSDVQNLFFQFSFAPGALFTASVSAAIIGGQGMPRWVGYLGSVVTVIQAIALLGTLADSGPLAAGGPASAVGLFSLVAWVFALSVTLVVKARLLANPLVGEPVS